MATVPGGATSSGKCLMRARSSRPWQVTLLFVTWGVLTLLTTGCASTAATVQTTRPVQTLPALSRYQNLRLEVTKADDVYVISSEMQRITSRIIEAIWAKEPDRFSTINAKMPDDLVLPTLHVTVRLTRYDKGNASARGVLAGLGQIHIDATVILRDQVSDETLGEYEVTKTFAWGGIYGASTSIGDVEVGFAEGIASLLLGRET